MANSGETQVGKICLKMMNNILLAKWDKMSHIKEIAGATLQK